MTKYQLTKAAKARGVEGVELVMLRILYNVNGPASAEKALSGWPAKVIQGTVPHAPPGAPLMQFNITPCEDKPT